MKFAKRATEFIFSLLLADIWPNKRQLQLRAKCAHYNIEHVLDNKLPLID